jgi:hypothetical protein
MNDYGLQLQGAGCRLGRRTQMYADETTGPRNTADEEPESFRTMLIS